MKYSSLLPARGSFARHCLLMATLCLSFPSFAAAQKMLIPMDDAQQNHLKAYGVTYNALKAGFTGEWLLNYRGGSFLFPDSPELAKTAALAGVSTKKVSVSELATMRAEIAAGNMETIPLEKAPSVAIYTPPKSPPWDDAVTLALQYAGIEYTTVWDDEVVAGDLSKYEWLHLHHEDFTGQMNKFYVNYRGTPWFTEQVDRSKATAAQLGFASVPELKKAVADKIRTFVENGGFLFAMCGATETLELAVAGKNIDIAHEYADGSPVTPRADALMDWTRSFAAQGARLEASPVVNSMSNIDGHQVNVLARRQPLGSFSLFAFSAKFDPVPAMLTQSHRSVIADFYGVTTSFSKETLKPGVTILAQEEGAPWVKYIHGALGKGSYTFLGGHDPEDPQHAIGSPPTDLSLRPNSPGYRLILNNVLFPAAKKKPLKT
jgi:hypothetical protein